MYKVDIYVLAEPASTRKSKKKYGYLLSCISRGKEQIRVGTGSLKGTYHEATLQAINEALGRLTQSCEVRLHCEDRFVLNMIEHNLESWEKADYKTSKGEPVVNEVGWRECRRLTRGQKIVPVPGAHERKEEIKKEMEKAA